jgi:hypothetical protein
MHKCYNVLIILKYYIYVCRCKCRDPDLEGDFKFLKYAINIEKASMIYLFPVQKEHGKRTWAELCSVKPRSMSFALKGKLRPHIFRKLPIDNQKFRT